MSVYICHYCLKYATPQRYDLIRHLSRKIKCKLNYIPSTMLSREQFGQISISKKYTIPIPVENLTLSDRIYLVTEYHDPINVVPENFRSRPVRIPQIENEDKREIVDEQDTGEYSLSLSQNATCYNDLVSDGINGYQCPLCKSYYASKQSLVKHLKNQKVCRERQELNAILSTGNKVGRSHGIQSLSSGDIQAMTGSSGTHPSIILQNQQAVQQQNVHIQQNQSINVNQNSFNFDFKINDFMHEIYDHTHLDYRELSTDFYLLKNFLKLILENKSNQNILFLEEDKTNAVVYTRDNIRKMSNEKAGFILLEKLYKTMDNLIENVVGEENKDKYKYMIRYYKIIINKYRCDTTFRDYDAETKKFEATSHGNQLRSRDEYLAEIMGIIQQYGDSIQETLFSSVDCKSVSRKFIDLNPNIEDFASRRLRYRN